MRLELGLDDHKQDEDGIIEAPRGTLIHYYKVDANGAVVWTNLNRGHRHNNLAIAKSVRQASEHSIKGAHLKEGI